MALLKFICKKHSQRIVKKLKNEYKQNSALKSRFKREFEIMQSLSQVNGIIKVYELMSQSLAIRWRKLILSLNDYIVNNELKLNQIFNLLFQILTIMADVHSRGIYHRDLSQAIFFYVMGL